MEAVQAQVVEVRRGSFFESKLMKIILGNAKFGFGFDGGVKGNAGANGNSGADGNAGMGGGFGGGKIILIKRFQ